MAALPPPPRSASTPLAHTFLLRLAGSHFHLTIADCRWPTTSRRRPRLTGRRGPGGVPPLKDWGGGGALTEASSLAARPTLPLLTGLARL
jgi:hypothetical protein